MKNYFVTGAGTDVGKTLITCALTHQLQQAGKTVRAIKPVVSGFDENVPGQSDTGLLLKSMGLPISKESTNDVSPWRFAPALSPDMAAEDEARPIAFDALVTFCRQQHNADYLLVEGVGGVMVPLDTTHSVLDWIAALAFPVILVTGSYLGALSHTLTAARVLLAAGAVLHAVVISESEQSPVPLARMQATLRRFLPEEVRIATLGRLDSSDELWKYAPDLLHTLML